MIFNIKVNENKTVEYDEIVVNQYENKIDYLEFVLPFEDCSYLGVFKSPNNKKLEIPIVDNRIIIDKKITSISGTWNLIVVANKDDTTFISNPILLNSCRNYLNLKLMQELDTNISLLYSEIQDTLQKLNDTGLNEISSVVSELQEINNKLDDKQVSDTVSHISNKSDTIILKLNSIISDISSLSENIRKLENIESDLKTLDDKVSAIPTDDYTGAFAEIKNLLTDADAIADEIKGA